MAMTGDVALALSKKYVEETMAGAGAIKGDKGDKGADGKSAYEVALDNGFEGTEEEWLESLKGETGNVEPSTTFERHNLITGDLLDGLVTKSLTINTSLLASGKHTEPIYLKEGDTVYAYYHQTIGGASECAFECYSDGLTFLSYVQGENIQNNYVKYDIPKNGYYSFNVDTTKHIPCVTKELDYLGEGVGIYLPNVSNKNDILKGVNGLIRYNLITEVLDGYWSGTAPDSKYWRSNAIPLRKGDIVYLSGNVYLSYGTNAVLKLCDETATTALRDSVKYIEKTDAYLKFEIPYDGYYSANIQKDSCLCYDPVHLDKSMGLYLPEDTMNVSSLLKGDASSPLMGKKISVTGDSICANLGGGYARIIADMFGMGYENLAVGGGTITAEQYRDNGGARHWICRDIANMCDDADYYLLEGGVNDASLAIPLGNMAYEYTGEFDETTFIGAFESMLRQAVVKFKGKKLGYIAVHKMNKDYHSTRGENYYHAAKRCCEKWGVPFLDLNNNVAPFFYIEELKQQYTTDGDGWHPNDEGYRKYYVPKIIAFLESL